MLAGNAADIGNIVRRRRTKAGLTQAELAARIGVSRKWIADLEGGHPRAQLQLVLDVLNALEAVVDVTDAPARETSLDALARVNAALPTVSVSPDLSQALTRVAQSARFSPELERAIGRALALTAINPDQMAAIRNAVAHLPLDHATSEAISRASKELTRAEADWAGVPHRIGPGGDDEEVGHD